MFVLWEKMASPTKIALVDFQAFQTASIVKANTDKFIAFEEVPLDKLDKLKRYDFVLGFGMGMHITAEQREQIRNAADKGVPLYIHAATNPDNNICTLDSVRLKVVKDYLNNGNKKNYQSLSRYIRQEIDGKNLFVNPPDSVFKIASDVLYHLDENVWFEEVRLYENYLKNHNFYMEGGAKIAIIGGLNDPFSGNKENMDSLIVSLQRAGLNVYPVTSVMKRLDFLKEIQPDAVIYLAHGRMIMGKADAAVDWLKERNIPVFSPLSLLQTKEEWLADPMGMFGGFMSQSIVMPELDGAIYPYMLNAQEIDENGLYLFKAVPERLQAFTQIVTNFISLRKKNNAEKKLAIYYFKGAGQSTLTAQGLETVPALYNLLKRLKNEGYKLDNLPAEIKDFEKVLMTQGAVFNTYAKGVFDDFLQQGHPALIEKQIYETWANQFLPKEMYADVVARYGEAPGDYMTVQKDGKNYLAVARISFGNIVLLPQPMAGLGDDAFAIVHGAKSAPPHTYIASYLWSQHDFKADAMLHFGTHGSLEFTPQKQVALSHYDWPDRLVGTVPHFYYYTIGNIGESMMAKRRSYATILSYLTPAFMESDMRLQFKTLEDKIRSYYKTGENKQASLEIKKLAVSMGLHRDLRLDSVLTNPYTTEDIERIENFAEEIANEKMTGSLYTSGIPYSDEKIRSTVLAMSADPIAYSMANLDKMSGKTTEKQLKNKVLFTQKYLAPAKALVNRILNGAQVNEELAGSAVYIAATDLAEAKTILAPKQRTMPGRPSAPSVEYSSEQKARARAIVEIERTIQNIVSYKNALEQSPEKEFRSLLNAFAGGYIAPSSGGDAVANPDAVPTGRNLYSINAEATPSETAWEKGVSLVDATLEQYKKQHDAYPRKVSYTFWSSEFIESEGTTIAQVLYMLGVEPVRDSYGRVSDLQLIPSEQLGRPRIDVVVQTSGQFRDLAASRLELISRAVEMASASEDKTDNYVTNSTVETERLLVEQGISPKEARELSTQRVFGGLNGMYGTNIQGMVTSGDRWESEKEIADTYIHNMGAAYGSNKNWGQFQEGLLRAVLHHTDVVVQPRQSNTWGALSLDHVYEFMGGLNLAVREVTGKDPEAYFADYRNRNQMKIQELKEAIGVEARSTVFNSAYIKEVMKGNASSAAQITEVLTNTYAWNVMKPNVIDNEMWDKLYDVYVKDAYNLGTEDFFKRENPYALQEITAVMLETARKGMWKASEQQLSDIAQLHTTLVKEFGPSGTGFAGGNAKLQDFIAQKTDAQSVNEYKQQIQQMKSSTDINTNGRVLKKEELGQTQTGERNSLNGLFIVSAVLVVFVLLLIVLRKKRKN
jgi:cobaltochelatase CobN